MFCNSLRQLIFTFTCFLLFSFQANAQQSHRFADTSATWQIVEREASLSFPPVYYASTFTRSVLGDTVFGNHTYQIIQTWGDPAYVRQDSGKVYTLDYWEGELPLYDFNLVVGDSIDVGIEGNQPSILRVDSVDTVNWGRVRKRMFLTWNDGNPLHDEIWIEGIGNLNVSFIQPFTRTEIYDGPTFTILCYSENEALVYQNPDYHDCFYDTVIYTSDKNILEEEVSIYPNPISDFLFIYLPQHEEVDVCLSSALGVELLCEKHSGNTAIDMRLYPESIYLLQIKSSKGSVVKKIILER